MPAPVARPVAQPVALPPGPLSRAQAEQYWGRDRSELALCRAEKGAALDFYDQLARQLRGVE